MTPAFLVFRKVLVRIGLTGSFNLWECPTCGAFINNLYVHGTWHAENDKKETN